MRILFISRKKADDVGGLSRFAQKLISFFPRARYPVDLIHLCDATMLPIGMFLKFLYRKPLTLTAHGLDLTFPNPIYQFLLKLLLPFADAIILDSPQAKKLLLPFNIKKPVYIISPGISTDQFKTATPCTLPNLKGKIVLLTVGNLVSRKGHIWFIKNVFQKLSGEFIYLIVGNGPQRSQIERLINKSHLTSRVYLLGKLTNPQLAFIFKLAHIYVAPNQQKPGDFEGFGLACGEAATLGLPVVASNVDGIPEVIKDQKNGYLVKPEAKEFVKTINQLKISKLRKKIGRRAKLYTKRNYSWQTTAEKYVKVFQGSN